MEPGARVMVPCVLGARRSLRIRASRSSITSTVLMQFFLRLARCCLGGRERLLAAPRPWTFHHGVLTRPGEGQVGGRGVVLSRGAGGSTRDELASTGRVESH